MLAAFTSEPLVVAFITIVALNAIGWAVSSYLQSDMLYDLIGAASHLLAALLSTLLSPEIGGRNLIGAIMIGNWAVRLGMFLFQRVIEKGHDKRLDAYVTKPKRFAILWFMQSLWVFINTLPLLLVNGHPHVKPVGVYEWCMVALYVFGFGIEALADQQKSTFRAKRSNGTKFIRTGLWRLSRHPNYFGEMVIWVAVTAFFAPALLSAGGLQPLALACPLFVIWLLLRVSGIPLLEADAQKRWGADAEYQAYVRETNVLVPWFPRKSLRDDAALPTRGGPGGSSGSGDAGSGAGKSE